MIDIVKDFLEGSPVQMMIEQFHIKSNKYTHDVTSKKFFKVYQVVSEKRRIVGNFTYPYGYNDFKNE